MRTPAAPPRTNQKIDFEIELEPADGTKAVRRNGDFGTSPYCKQPSVEQIWMTVGGRYFVGGVNAMTNEGSRYERLNK
jgi:hypothetical protein